MSEDNKSNNIENKKPAIDLSRRRLAKAALVATPIALTLPSKPALAVNNNCTFSGNMSGNMSDAGRVDPCEFTYTGFTPGYWKNHEDDWAGTSVYIGHKFCMKYNSKGKCTQYGYKNGTSFKSIFFNDPYYGAFGMHNTGTETENRDMTMWEVVWKWFITTGNSSYTLGAHTVAAYLNAHYLHPLGLFPYTQDEVVELYNMYAGTDEEWRLKEIFETLNELENGYEDPPWS